jgi:hypothetical protein
MRVLGFALLLVSVIADVCLAQASETANTGPSARPIVLVMESSGGVRMATDLRAALNHDAVFRVLSLHEAQRQAVRPLGVLTVAAERARSVRVVYWKLGGESDSLTAATPNTADQLTAVVYALASALLERHKDDVGLESAEQLVAPGLDAAHASRAIYAMLGRWSRLTPRTNIELRFEDF